MRLHYEHVLTFVPTYINLKKSLHCVALITAVSINKMNCTEDTNHSRENKQMKLLETYLIPGTLGTSQHDLGLPSEDKFNCFLLGSVSPNPIPNNCPSVTETNIKSICKYEVRLCLCGTVTAVFPR